MATNNIWEVIKRWSRLEGVGDARRITQSSTLCKAGKHSVDPNWEECPLCKHEILNKDKNQTGTELNDNTSANEIRSNVMTSRKQTSVGGGESIASNRRETKLDTYAGDFQPAHDPSRKIVGVMVTFSWHKEGQLFRIYEGKNYIGRGTVENEGGRLCDVLIEDDQTLSNEHALIIYRAGRYELFDQRSTTGTFLNDEYVDDKATLSDRAKIKTGATVWQFLKIDSDVFESSKPQEDSSVSKKRTDTVVG